MADKETSLSIVIRTVDKATAGIKAINARLDAVTKPTRDFGKALGDLREKSGLNDVIDGFKGVGSAIGDLLGKVAVIGGVVGLAVAGVFHLVKEFDDLGDKAEAIGVSAQYLAEMRYAAERSGVAVEALDQDLQTFSTNIGKLRDGGKGKLAAFLEPRLPKLLEQIRATKDNVAAVDVLANAMAKITDPAKRAALAQAAFGDAAANPLLQRGAKGIKELRDRYKQLNHTSMDEAAKKAGEVDDALKDLKATTDGLKASIVIGLGPALKVIVERLQKWASAIDFEASAKAIGDQLPEAFDALVDAVKRAIDFLTPFFDSTTKIKIALGVLAAVVAGPLISAIVSLGIALLSTPVGWFLAGIAAIAAGAYLLITHWDEVKAFFADLWESLGERFGQMRDLLALLLAPFIYVPAQIIANWGSIEAFFVGLWDGVTSVFEKAWSIIGAIVDKVMAAVNAVKGAYNTVKDFFHTDTGPGTMSDQFDRLNHRGRFAPDVATAAAALGPMRMGSDGRIVVEFKNTPTGTRVNTEGPANVETNVGFQLLGAM